MRLLVFDSVILIKHSIRTQFHHVQDTLKFVKNEKFLDILFTLLSGLIVSVLTSNLFLEIESISEIKSLPVKPGSKRHLHPHDLLSFKNQIPLKIIKITLKTSLNDKTYLKSICISLK